MFKKTVCLEGLTDDGDKLRAFECYTDGSVWNGWQIPYMTARQLEILAAATNTIWRVGLLAYYRDCHTDEVQTSEAILCDTVDGPLELYDVGFGLIWDDNF